MNLVDVDLKKPTSLPNLKPRTWTKKCCFWARILPVFHSISESSFTAI